MEVFRERDACGVGFVANTQGETSHAMLKLGLEAVTCLTHRGAVDADARTGDGAGVLTQIPYDFFLRELARFSFVPESPGSFGVAVLFLPRQEPVSKERCLIIVEEALSHFNLELIGFRPVPVDTSHLGDKAAEARPDIFHALIKKPPELSLDDFERTLYIARREIERHVGRKGIREFYISSMSCRTIVYKGMFVAPQLGAFYQDLQDPLFKTSFCLFHQRYSTNTFPNWQLAQPFRMLAHNGEINTLEGNRNWIRAKESIMESPLFSSHLKQIFPIVQAGGSDSQSLDNVLELLVMAGRDPLQAACMLVPEAWRKVPEMDESLKAFYEYHESIMEPWDGPAALTFTNGEVVAACLDRNGLRPARYIRTSDGTFILGSEVGLAQKSEREIVEKGRLGPGEMIAVDVKKGRIVRNAEIKERLAHRKPYRVWIQNQLQVVPEKLHRSLEGISCANLSQLQKAFGYTQEELQLILRPMAAAGKEPTWSMGDDTPLSLLSPLPKLLYTYFKQRFAQVTNPPIDPLREEIVCSLHTVVGKRLNPLAETERHAHLICFNSPVITVRELEFLKRTPDPYFRHAELACLFERGREGALKERVEELADEAVQAVRDGKTLLILSDRKVSQERVPVPHLLACGAIHHRLIQEGLRMKASLICETGEAREVHHFAALLGYGATLICPYLALASVLAPVSSQKNGEGARAAANYLQAAEQGILKIMSKMGISTLSSYRGAQVFEALGLDPEILDFAFRGTPCRVSGISFAALQKDYEAIHAEFLESGGKLKDLGFYRYRKWGEYHANFPPAIKKLQQAVREKSEEAYREFSAIVQSRPPTALRDLLVFRKAKEPLPLEEVEPVEAIFKRFTTAAMSHGALSREAHENLAIAMNAIGGKSDSGEGGEDPERFLHRKNGDWANSAIKQVASGRFGVTPSYLAAASELEIKMAQGSKPGEGGQLPGHKVSAEIARLRFSVPGVTLISPPPHHDIYSIEDLAELIYDLKHINPLAKVAVKLVAIAGVGTIAAGVAKAYADVIHISGADGGTGASPASSIKYAGVPWELGLAETQQTLVHNGLRGRVTLRTDGGLRTGRDVVMAALLGAEEFGFGTTALIAEGCVMARQCHLNTCPVGVATQREDLRKKFPGKPEHVVNYFTFVAQEIREILSALGFRSLEEIVGRVDLLEPKEIPLAKAKDVDLSFFLTDPDPLSLRPRRNMKGRNNRIDYALDDALIQRAREAVVHGRSVELAFPIRNTQRAVGAKLSGHIAYFYGYNPMPGAIRVEFTGTAGQSFGAFLTHGVSLVLFGDANDYVGKGLGGGEIVIRKPRGVPYSSYENVIVGNTCFYGATGGRAFIAGRAGERFCVRNSGAVVVVEGVGDHGCEYMTGGIALILGSCGKNFAAGMTGGVAFVLDEENTFSARVNRQIVGVERLEKEEDIKLVEKLLKEHCEKTESEKAEKVLSRLQEYLPLFWKVLPPPPAVAEARSEKKVSERA